MCTACYAVEPVYSLAPVSPFQTLDSDKKSRRIAGLVKLLQPIWTHLLATVNEFRDTFAFAGKLLSRDIPSLYCPCQNLSMYVIEIVRGCNVDRFLFGGFLFPSIVPLGLRDSKRGAAMAKNPKSSTPLLRGAEKRKNPDKKLLPM